MPRTKPTQKTGPGKRHRQTDVASARHKLQCARPGGGSELPKARAASQPGRARPGDFAAPAALPHDGTGRSGSGRGSPSPPAPSRVCPAASPSSSGGETYLPNRPGHPRSPERLGASPRGAPPWISKRALPS